MAYIVCLNHNLQSMIRKNLLTIAFRRPIHHCCSTFPIQQETAVRDMSHPVAADATLDKGTIRGRWQLSDWEHFSSEVRVYGGWRQGQEMEQDVVDSAIPQDAGKCNARHRSSSWLMVWSVDRGRRLTNKVTSNWSISFIFAHYPNDYQTLFVLHPPGS